MTSFEDRLDEAVQFIREHVTYTPKIGLILGSGLGEYADSLGESIALSSSSIPHYRVSTVEGHEGKLVFGKIDGKPLLAFQGRVHFYESNDVDSILFPVHVGYQMGVRILIITNAAGGINRSFTSGNLMVISDQIDLTTVSITSNLRSEASPKAIYSKRLIDRTLSVSKASGIPIRHGTYVGVKGSSYETASEVEMIRRIGGDAVGMSTVLEAKCAASLGMEVLGISCITNLATGITGEELSHAEVTEVGNSVKKTFSQLIGAIIGRL